MDPYVPYITLAVGGVATHLIYFKNAEHHFYGLRYISFAMAFFLTGWAALFRVGGMSAWEGFTTMVTISSSYLSGLYTSLITYRLFFHPLKKFPGPFLAKISSLWYSTNLGKMDAPRLLMELHGKYGDFVRVGSSDISIIHPEGPNALYGFGTKCTKGIWYDNDYPHISMHTSRSKTLHDSRRRVWSGAFSDKALRGYEDRIRKYNDKLMDQISGFEGKPLNATKWLNCYTFDVMGDLAFGAGFDALEKDGGHEAMQLLDEGLGALGFWLPAWLFRILTAIPKLAASYWKFVDYCAKKLESRFDNKPEVPDIMAALLDPFKGKKPSGEELSMLHGDSRLIIVAGSDTTAATLTHVFHYLAKHPEQQEKLRKEIVPYIEMDGTMKHANVHNAEHLNGVINEALRLHPPVPSAVSRLTPPEGVQVGDVHVPGNITAWTPQYVIGRSDKVYKSPYEFRPERWYSEPDMVLEKTAFAPFSAGVYACIGKPLALLEMRTIISELVYKFDVQFAPGETGRALMEETRDHFTLGMAELDLCFKRRVK